MLLLDERILADGRHARTWARVAGDRVEIHDDDGSHGVLSVAALGRVMSRYGRPLDPGVALPARAKPQLRSSDDQDGKARAKPALRSSDDQDGKARAKPALRSSDDRDGDARALVLELPGGYRLRRLRYHAGVDAIGRDYLVWEQPPDEHGAALEPLCVVATMATAALRYLVLRLSAERPQETEA